jgi:hypothetical protein
MTKRDWYNFGLCSICNKGMGCRPKRSKGICRGTADGKRVKIIGPCGWPFSELVRTSSNRSISSLVTMPA